MKVSGSRIAKIAGALIAGLILYANAGWAGGRTTSSSPAVVAGLIQSAEQDFNSGNYANAITTLRAAVSQNPSDADSYYWLGRCYYEIRDYDNAIAQLEKAVSLDGKNSTYHQWLGRAYGGRADRNRSFFDARSVKKEFEEAVQLDSSNIPARRDLEQYCLEAPWIAGGSKEEALAQVNAITALDPIEGLLSRALYDREELKNPGLAENDYRQVLSAKPAHVEPYLEVADFFESQNKPEDMKAAIEAAAEVNPKDPRLAFYRGVYHVLSGTDLGNAEEYLKAYLASTPDRSDWPSHAAAREWLGKLYQAEGKLADAAEQYRAALQLDPGRKDARARLDRLEKAAP